MRRDVAEDLDGGVDVTTVATVPAGPALDARPRGAPHRRGGRRAGRGRGLLVRLRRRCRDHDAPRRTARRSGGGDDLLRRGPDPRPAHRRATGAQPALPPLRGRDADPRVGRRARRHRRPVRDTRKTTPGLRVLEKYAVRCGGGVNHRMSLSDAALVKDNHVVAAGGVAAAFEAVRAMFPGVAVEVEVDSLGQLNEVLDAGADLVLLDNFDADQMRAAVRRDRGPRLRARGLRRPDAAGGRGRRGHRRRLRRGRCAHPLRPGARRRRRPAPGVLSAARHRRRQHQHRPRPVRRRGARARRTASRPTPLDRRRVPPHLPRPARDDPERHRRRAVLDRARGAARDAARCSSATTATCRT